MNTFDPTTHTYAISGRKVPSVTQVLSDLLPCYQAGEWYLQRGTAVHACAAMVAQGIDFDHDPQIAGQVAACRRFMVETGFVCLATEWELFSAKYGFAGTMDVLGSLANGTILILDWKASFSASLPYQLGGYGLLLDDSDSVLKANKGVGVQLCEDGTYHMSPVYDLRRYKQGFLSLISAYNIRRECKVKQEEQGND